MHSLCTPKINLIFDIHLSGQNCTLNTSISVANATCISGTCECDTGYGGNGTTSCEGNYGLIKNQLLTPTPSNPINFFNSFEVYKNTHCSNF